MPETKTQQAVPMQIQIEVDEATAQGVYANLALISHSENEFVLDFMFIQPQPGPQGQPKAKVRARIISSPSHTKRFLAALAENVGKYEAQFGPVKLPSPEGPVTFH